MEGARSILLSITGGANLSLWEVNEAAKAVAEAAHPDANIIFGAMVDEKLDDQVWVTVVATGYGDGQRVERPKSVREDDAARPAASPGCSRACRPTRPSAQPRRATYSRRRARRTRVHPRPADAAPLAAYSLSGMS